MTVDLIIEDSRWKVTDLQTIADTAVTATLAHLNITADIAILACDDTRIAALNADFRGKPVPTNVLSWPSGDRMPGKVPDDTELGDIAIAFDTCRQEAAEQDKPFEAHVIHLLIHATLHLLGHDHQTDAEAARMEALEVKILAGLGFPDPYASGRE